jgi:hypothetical protein
MAKVERSVLKLEVVPFSTRPSAYRATTLNCSVVLVLTRKRSSGTGGRKPVMFPCAAWRGASDVRETWPLKQSAGERGP